jgi:PleD family two-component response regulator
VGTTGEKTVLIVDNQPRETAALQKQLAFAGFKIEIATTGAGAIKILEEHPPDIVLIEASFSDIDSVEVVAFIRSDLRTCRLPVFGDERVTPFERQMPQRGLRRLPSKTDQDPRSRCSN